MKRGPYNVTMDALFDVVSRVHAATRRQTTRDRIRRAIPI